VDDDGALACGDVVSGRDVLDGGPDIEGTGICS